MLPLNKHGPIQLVFGVLCLDYYLTNGLVLVICHRYSSTFVDYDARRSYFALIHRIQWVRRNAFNHNRIL
jgi:hypothetical protein